MNTFTLGLIVVAYLLSLAYLGFLGYKKTTSASDYLVGGRQMNPIVMALSYGATFISVSAIVGFGGVFIAVSERLIKFCHKLFYKILRIDHYFRVAKEHIQRKAKRKRRQ